MGSKFCPMCISSADSTGGSRKRRKGHRSSQESVGSDNDDDNFYRPSKEALKSKTSSISTSDPEQPFHVPSIFKPIRVDSPALFIRGGGSSSTVSENQEGGKSVTGELPGILQSSSAEEDIGFTSKAVGTEDDNDNDDGGDNFESDSGKIRKKIRQNEGKDKRGMKEVNNESRNFAESSIQTDDISKENEKSLSSPASLKKPAGSKGATRIPAFQKHQQSPIIPRARPRAGSDFRKRVLQSKHAEDLPRSGSIDECGVTGVDDDPHGNDVQECAHSLSSQSSRSLSVNYETQCLLDPEARRPLLQAESELDFISDEDEDEEEEVDQGEEQRQCLGIDVDVTPESASTTPTVMKRTSLSTCKKTEKCDSSEDEGEEREMLEISQEKFVIPEIIADNDGENRESLMDIPLSPISSRGSTPCIPPPLPDCPPPDSENDSWSRSGSNTRCHSRLPSPRRKCSSPQCFNCRGALCLKDMSEIHFMDSASSCCASDVEESDNNKMLSLEKSQSHFLPQGRENNETVYVSRTEIIVGDSDDDQIDQNDFEEEIRGKEVFFVDSPQPAQRPMPIKTVTAAVNTDIVMPPCYDPMEENDEQEQEGLVKALVEDRSDSEEELRSASTTPTPPPIEEVGFEKGRNKTRLSSSVPPPPVSPKSRKEGRSCSVSIMLMTPKETQTENYIDTEGDKIRDESELGLEKEKNPKMMMTMMPSMISYTVRKRDEEGNSTINLTEEQTRVLQEGFYYSELDLDLALQNKHMQASGKWHYPYHSTGHVPTADDPRTPLVPDESRDIAEEEFEEEEDDDENTIEDLKPLIATSRSGGETLIGSEEGVEESPQVQYRGIRTNVTGSWFSLSSSSSLEDYEESELLNTTAYGSDSGVGNSVETARKRATVMSSATNVSFDPERWSPESSPSLSVLSYEEILQEKEKIQQDVQRVVDAVKEQFLEKGETDTKGGNNALDLASQSNVQDAFVIAVEQQARERLEKLSALKKIKPVDMTKLSHQLSEAPSESGETSAELNGLIEAATGSPIYVTSASELNSSQSALHRTAAAGSSSVAGEESQEEGKPSPARSITPTSSASAAKTVISSGGPELSSASPSRRSSSNVTVVGVNSSSTTGGTCLPNGQYSSGATTAGDRSAASSIGEPVLPTKKSISKESVNGSRKSGSRESIADSRESVQFEGAKPSPSRSRGSASKLSSSRESVIEASTSSQHANMINMVEWDNGPEYREMAVDVPESFVGTVKTPPRYPPTNKTTTLNSNNNKTAGKSVVSDGVGVRGNGASTLPHGQNGAAGKPVPPPRIGDKEGVYGVNNNTTQVPHVTPRTVVGQQAKTAATTPSRDEAERIRKYQEELKKRREQEEKHAKEEEFLRTSLRGSKKLQALESVREDGRSFPTGEPKGFVNQAYDLDGDRISHPPHDITLQKPVGLPELVASLQRVQQALKKHGIQLDEALTLMQTPEFQQVLAVHNKVQDVWCFNTPPAPVTAHAQHLNQECLESLYNCSSPASAELVEILSRIDMDGVLHAHDKIAERERLLMTAESPLNAGEPVDPVILPSSAVVVPPALPAVPTGPPVPVVSGSHLKSVPRPAFVPEPQPDDHIKVVRIEKTQDPLGATVRNDGDAVVIGRIVKGGAAERSGLLHEGDEILEVNGVEMRGKSVNEVCDILSRMTGTLTFLIVPTQVPQPPIQQRREILIHVRAHFDYDPEDDIYIPCRELGVQFAKGDVLHVINQEDPNWWQAHREGEEDQQLAGLIPSKSFQEQREAVKQTLLGETETREKTKKGTLLCAKTHRKKKKKIPYSSAFNDEFDAEEIPTYEEVALYYPRTSFKRPVVLIGPPNIGRHELRQRLMQESDRFAAAVPHTSRSRKDGEIDGQDYHFISRAQFESDILSRKFVEHGEFEKAYYGTSLDAIRSVVNAGKICVLNLHPQSLKMLRNSDLKPYIVFIAPPPLERLKQMRIARGEAYKEDELIDSIEKAREMEEKYGHYFDLVIVNNDIERTYHELVQRINYIEREPQWVPAFWLKQ